MQVMPLIRPAMTQKETTTPKVMGTAHLSLLEALTLPLGQARVSWNRWRAAADIDKLDYESFVLLPALTGRFEPWLDGDPFGHVLLGICRRAWSQNQVRQRDFEAARAVLELADIRQVASIGPLAWSNRYWPDRAIRPVGSVDLLIAPSDVPSALQALLKAGYTNSAKSHHHYFAPPISLQSPSSTPIRLHWRVMPNTAFALRRQPPIDFDASVPAEEALVSAAGNMFNDGMDWRCDATMIARATPIDWNRVAFHLRWRPQARRNLAALAAAGYAEIPSLLFHPGWPRLLEPAAALLRVYRAARWE
jgi:hypothetical protein